MEKEEMMVLANVVVAFSTFIGVGGALAYYMKEIEDITPGTIVITIITYIMLGIILLSATRRMTQ